MHLEQLYGSNNIVIMDGNQSLVASITPDDRIHKFFRGKSEHMKSPERFRPLNEIFTDLSEVTAVCFSPYIQLANQGRVCGAPWSASGIRNEIEHFGIKRIDVIPVNMPYSFIVDKNDIYLFPKLAGQDLGLKCSFRK